MPVLDKLMDARINLQGMNLKKSGHNKFAGYSYYELGDFLPHIQKIFQGYKMCGFVSFGTDIATLRIVDTEDNSFIDIQSPMSSAALKGCHEVQNLGAVQTYIRRYLWVTALEIVEHDALDATTGSVEPKPKTKSVESLKKAIDEASSAELLKIVWQAMTPDERALVRDYAAKAGEKFK